MAPDIAAAALFQVRAVVSPKHFLLRRSAGKSRAIHPGSGKMRKRRARVGRYARTCGNEMAGST